MKFTGFNVLIARFPYGESEHPSIADWLAGVFAAAQSNKGLVKKINTRWVSGTPITMLRNRAVLTAGEDGADILFMLDNDTIPADGFFLSALEFIANRYDEGPTVIASPYCGPPPYENVFIFRWESYETNDPAQKYKLVQYTRSEASKSTGIEQVAAIPTGCCAIDMRIFTGFAQVQLPTPWFYYEYTDKFQSEKASTEDVVFSRNVSSLFGAKLGIPTVFVDWDRWSVHVKPKKVERPGISYPAHIMQMFNRYLEGDS